MTLKQQYAKLKNLLSRKYKKYKLLIYADNEIKYLGRGRNKENEKR